MRLSTRHARWIFDLDRVGRVTAVDVATWTESYASVVPPYVPSTARQAHRPAVDLGRRAGLGSRPKRIASEVGRRMVEAMR